jgi:hypothetical protein
MMDLRIETDKKNRTPQEAFRLILRGVNVTYIIDAPAVEVKSSHAIKIAD